MATVRDTIRELAMMDEPEPTLAHILNTLVRCDVQFQFPKRKRGYLCRLWWDWIDIDGYNQCYNKFDEVRVTSRTSPDDALRRAWSRRKVQRIVEERTK